MRLVIVIGLLVAGTLSAQQKKKAKLSTSYKKSLVWAATRAQTAPRWEVELVDFTTKFPQKLYLKKLLKAAAPQEDSSKSQDLPATDGENSPENEAANSR